MGVRGFPLSHWLVHNEHPKTRDQQKYDIEIPQNRLVWSGSRHVLVYISWTFSILWNLLRTTDCRPFSVLKTLTGSRAEKCHKTWFSVNQTLVAEKRCQDTFILMAGFFRFCEIYWEYRTAGHLVFWKPWLAVELKKFLRPGSDAELFMSRT